MKTASQHPWTTESKSVTLTASVSVGPWKDAVPVFAELGFQCPQFKNPTDYFMKVASDTDNIPTLAQAQQHRWISNGSARFSSRAALAPDVESGETGTGAAHHSLRTKPHALCKGAPTRSPNKLVLLGLSSAVKIHTGAPHHSVGLSHRPNVACTQRNVQCFCTWVSLFVCLSVSFSVEGLVFRAHQQNTRLNSKSMCRRKAAGDQH